MIRAALVGVLVALGLISLPLSAAHAQTDPATSPATEEAGRRAPTFLMVLPRLGSPVLDEIRRGCEAAATELNVVCRAVGPTAADADQMAAILTAALAESPAGIAVVAGQADTGQAILAARRAGIPVVTVDGEFPGTPREAFIGTNNKDFGRAMATTLRRMMPRGGRIGVITGDASTPALDERLEGLRDALGEEFVEVEGSPFASNGDPAEALAIARRLAMADPPVKAIVSLGAWPMLDAEAWRSFAIEYKDRIDRADLLLMVADALPDQRLLLAEGLVHALVAPRARDLGARSLSLLVDLTLKRKTPEVLYVGFDVFMRSGSGQ